MSAPALRPLSVGEILDAGIKIYSKNARTLMVLTAIVVLPFAVLSAFVTLSTARTSSEVPRGFTGLGAIGTTEASASVGGRLLLSILGVVVGLLTVAACVKAVSDAYLGQPTSVEASLRFAASRLLSLFWLEILVTVLLTLAFIALIVPGIWLYAAWSVATPALMIDGVRGWQAMKRSYRLVRGRWWPTAGVLFVANLMIAIVGSGITAIFLAISLSGANHSVVSTVFLTSLVSALSSVLTRPFQAAVTTVLYYDLRVRHEGYDVELLAEQLGLAPVALGPLAPPPSPFVPEPPPELPSPPEAPPPLPAGGPGAPQALGPESVGQPGGPPHWPPPPGWRPPPPGTPPGAGR